MIELNGIANIKILMDQIYKNSEGLDYESFTKLEQQVEVLHEYLKEVATVMQKNYKELESREFGSARVVPYWHEVREKTLKKS